MNAPTPATTRGTHWMEWLYVALAVVGLAGTSVQLPGYLKLVFIPGTIQFWKETVATPASTFIVVDIFILGGVVLIWMFGECRRLGISPRWAWTYFLGSLLIGISCFVPLFFAHRHRCLRLQHPEQQAIPGGSDFIGMAIVLLVAAAAAFYSFSHMPAF